jgi:thioredoxin-dependent peroxiredoxin
MLAVGQPVPAFDLVNQRGTRINSSALKGQRYVLYFYPKDDTPGCTKEACGFRDALPKFDASTVKIFGVSADDQKAHAKFAEKYGLSFDLLADTERKLIEGMGVWVEKSMYGKKYMGILRASFVIGADGRVEHSWDKVDTATHAQDVLAYLHAGAGTKPGAIAKLPAASAKQDGNKKVASGKAAVKQLAPKQPIAQKAPTKKSASKKAPATKALAKKAQPAKSVAKKAAGKTAALK